LLASLGCKAYARVSVYARDRYNRQINQALAPLEDGATLQLGASTWTVTLEPLAVCGAALACEITFACAGGALAQAAVAVDFTFTGWSGKTYVLLPGAAYDGNRFLSRKIPYSPKLCEVRDIGPDKPVIITDVPRLNVGEGPSRIQERSGSLSVPCLGFHDPARKTGFLLLTEQANALGDLGLGVEESRDRSRATFSITSPVVRELTSYRICDCEHPSDDRPRDFASGDRVTLRFALHAFNAPDIQSLFDRFAALRKAPLRAFASSREKGTRADLTLPYSACLALQIEKFNRENFVPEHGYYAVGPRTNFLQDWQIGWTGGMITTYPLLAAGDEQTRDNVRRNFDWLFPDGLSPSGFFWDCGANGTQWFGGDIRRPHTSNWHLIRKSGDAVFYILKQFALMERLGLEVKPAWREGVRRVCDSFVRLWTREGQFGQFVDALTGEVRVGGSTGGAIAPAGLALAARAFADATYLNVAQEAGEHFYRNFTRRGLSCGGPGDACQNPDSESGYALVESYVALAETTGDAVWLARAGEAARQFASWVVSYDFAFPPASTFARAGIRTTGAVYANTQNKHAAPGICTYSGLGLLKLFRATGDRFFLDLLHDIAHNLPQYLPHPLRPLGAAAPGHMCERVNMTDWEGPERIGETLNMSTWAETSLLLTAIEIPGLYVQPDHGLAVAFDNVEARVVTDSPEALGVELRNPAPLAAVVTVLAENAAQAKRPLAEAGLVDACRERLEPGEKRTLLFDKAREVRHGG